MADAKGRAKGKARGRARPPTTQQNAPSGPADRPLSSMVSQPMPATGRAMHRGSGLPLGEGSTSLSREMEQLGLGGHHSSESSGSNVSPVGRGKTPGGERVLLDTITTRPQTLNSKNGSSGQLVKLQANYFSLVSEYWFLYKHRVDFAPNTDNLRERKKLLRDQKQNIKGEYMFDGTVLYCSHQITRESIELFSARDDGSQVRITIRFVGELGKGDADYFQFFNILTRRCFEYLKLQLIKRDFYDPQAKIIMPAYHMELWPGYITTIRQHENTVLMCAEITHKVMRNDTCHNLLKDCIKRDSQNYKNIFMELVLGRVVLTDYNNRTHIINDVEWDQSPQSSFQRNDGSPVTFINYYREKYNITIRDVQQPLLISRTKPRQQRAYEQKAAEQAGESDPKLNRLIPELCKMTGLTPEMRKEFRLMKEMAIHTRINPGDRIERLMAMNRRLSSEERIRNEFEKWNLNLSNQLMNVPGRVLQPETIVFGNSVTVSSGNECDWTRALRSNPMFVTPQGGLSEWVVIYPKTCSHDVESFVDLLCKAARGMNFNITQPEYVELWDDKTTAYVGKIDEVISHFSPKLIFVVVNGNKPDKYSAIKKKSLVDRAVPTQVFLSKNLNSKGVMSIATKIAIQMNCKIGGAPWSVVMPLGGLMVIGYDTCHDTKSKGKSCGAMVASLNKPMSRYFSAVSHHSIGEELSNDLALHIIKALQCYEKHNKTRPSHIVIYRDGVGDGQIPYVFNHEVDRIQKAMKDFYGYSPKFAFIIVSKRINTRLFANGNNPQPGTVVDDVITLPERYDFFIVSQYVTQGTVSPTSYNVIYDTLGLDPDKIQRLTFKLTHCYYNWSGTVRVPAPVQYAHKLAFLVGQSLHRSPHHSLEELLYFL